MFSKIVLVFAFCLVQVYSAEKVCDYLDYCYCTCLKDPEVAKAKYNKSLEVYAELDQSATARALGPYMPVVAKWQAGTVCSNKYFKSDLNTMAADFLSLCGGSPIGPDYIPDWDSLTTDEEICNFIFAKGPTMCKHMNVNLEVLSKCPKADNIIKALDHSFNVCEEGCTDEHLLDIIIDI